MKKIFSFLIAAFCLVSYAYADKVLSSETLPGKGRPEHLYTMRNANNVFVGKTTAPTQTEANIAQFAFYEVAGVTNGYHIYNKSNEKWLTYQKANSYSNGKDFVKFVGEQSSAGVFILGSCGGENYEIQPVTNSGGTDKYLNWYQGVDGNPYDGANTLGLWQDSGSKDNGSCWSFTEVVFVVRTYTVVAPEGVTVTILGKEYTNGSQITIEGSITKNDVSVVVPEGKFAVVSIDDVNNTINVDFATLPAQTTSAPYTNAWVYPMQQENVGEAMLTEIDGVYTLSNKVLAASFMKVGKSLYFAGSNAMNLQAGTEPFTVAFGNGDNVPASAMNLTKLVVEDLVGNKNAIGGAEHFDGKQLVAHYEYAYKGAKIAIVWRAVLRDGSHYLRTEMELKGIDNVDMFNVIPMIYNVDTKAAGSTPKVIGNTRGAVLMSNKIFAGLETPTAYNTVGEASGEADPWELAETKEPVSLTANSWQVVEKGNIPPRLTEATGANHPNVLAYTMTDVVLKKNQKVEILVKYTKGNHRLNFGGADLIDETNNIAASDYHTGYSGGEHSNNTFSFIAPYDGKFSIRVFVENMTEEIDASSTMSVKVYNAKAGAEINTSVVGIQGRWSRNTTLAAGEIWKVSAVVGLIAQDGTETSDNIHASQKRRSFLAYSERERAVPWRVFPHYNSWYELNIDRNNAAPGQEHTNFTAAQVLDVMAQWKKNYYDKYGQGIVAFVIDDGWDNYGTWTFHKGFPNQMRDMSNVAKEMGAGIGAWLGPVGGYGGSGNYRRAYWQNKGGMVLSNPEYYQVYLDAAENLVCNQDGQPGFNANTDNYLFFKYDGISAQFSALGPDPGDVGNENAEGIILLERYVRENMREDIFFNTTVGTWASPFWYQISDATWRQEGDYGEAGNNSIDREKWITYRDRLVYQNYITNSPVCPINTLMTHGFILTNFGAVSKNMNYEAVLRELRCAFVCGSGMVELYSDYALMNSINNGKLWEDLAECVAWQKKNADVLPDAHWVGGNPWTGSKHEVYGWASWNGAKSTLALRNGANTAQSYSFTLREALNIPANIKGAIILKKSFKVQATLQGLTEGTAIDIDQPLTVNLPASSVFAFDGVNADPSQVPFEVLSVTPGKNVEAIENIEVTFNAEIAGQFDPFSMNVMKFTKDNKVVASVKEYVTEDATLKVTLSQQVTEPGNYTLVIPEGLITRASDQKPYAGELTFTIVAPEQIAATSYSPQGAVAQLENMEVTFNKEIECKNPVAIVLTDDQENKVAATTCFVEGKTLQVTLDKTITTAGTYVLVIPAGAVVGKALGDSFEGNFIFTVDPYQPRNNGGKSRNDRGIQSVSLNAASSTGNTYELTAEENAMDFTDKTSEVTFKVLEGEEVTPEVAANGSWVHFYVYVDADNNGFTADVAADSYTPTGDLVSYSFYNNGADSDESGWNSIGESITGNNRNKPSLPAFKAPEKPGVYRLRFKQDWCNIDPAGDADGKFGDFKANGGQIIDVLLQVGDPTGIEKVITGNQVKSIYDLSGRKLNTISSSGVYIVNGKKQIVK